MGLPQEQCHVWMRLLAPDDAADVIQEAGPERRDELLSLLDEPTRREVNALLAYKEDEAGGLMNPRFARLRPESTVDEAISYLRRRPRRSIRSITTMCWTRNIICSAWFRCVSSFLPIRAN
jgi:magnesium transporter